MRHRLPDLLEARGGSSGPEIFRFGRSWAVKDFCGLSFVNPVLICTDLAEKAAGRRDSGAARGGAC